MVTSTEGYRYVLIVADVATRFVLLRPLRTKETEEVARTLFAIFGDFGVPKIMQSDNGGEFISGIVDAMVTVCGVDHRRISAYHPQANGLAEVNVKRVKAVLRKLGHLCTPAWAIQLVGTQMALNEVIAERTASKAFELLHARPWNTFADYSDVKSSVMTETELLERNAKVVELLFPSVEERVLAYNENVRAKFDKKHRIVSFEKGDVVYKKPDVFSKTERYEGPFKVVDSKGGAYALLDATGATFPRKVSPDLLKKADSVLYAVQKSDTLSSSGDGQLYEIDCILDHRGDAPNYEYLVRWKGAQYKGQDSWEPAEVFTSKATIFEYWKKAQAQAGKKKEITVSSGSSRTSSRRRRGK
jgi:transposase InsO family protein